jgi:hypothetical protein
MTVYVTKVWDFSWPVGPLPFRTEGWRANARRQLKPGDIVALVGTKGPPTAEADRGRLLGIIEPTTEPVSTLDFDVVTRPEHYDEDQNYKWPFGLLNRRAWRLIDRPMLEEISNRQFSMDAASTIIELTDDEAARVNSLRREEVPLLDAGIRARARVDGIDAARKATGPVPSTIRRGIMHMRSAPAYTYAMEVLGAGRPSFKIGWAFDFKIRARQFNQAAMPWIGGVQYKPTFFHLWDTAREAYRMEQKLLDHFKLKRHPQNREILYDVMKNDLEQTWFATISGKLR